MNDTPKTWIEYIKFELDNFISNTGRVPDILILGPELHALLVDNINKTMLTQIKTLTEFSGIPVSVATLSSHTTPNKHVTFAITKYRKSFPIIKGEKNQ